MERAYVSKKLITVGLSVMKIELLNNSFRGAPRHEEVILAALAIVPRKRRTLPVASGHFDAVNKTTLFSNEALMTLAAETFDPLRITRPQSESLMQLLGDAEFLNSDQIYEFSAALRRKVSLEATLNLYEFARYNLPEPTLKCRIIAVLDDIIARRYQAAR